MVVDVDMRREYSVCLVLCVPGSGVSNSKQVQVGEQS